MTAHADSEGTSDGGASDNETSDDGAPGTGTPDDGTPDNGTPDDDAPDDEKPLGKRLVQLIASIVVMTGVTVVVGYGGGLLLWISASLGGPDPRTEDGDLLRDRLLEWPDRNREFMRNNGRGEFPWTP